MVREVMLLPTPLIDDMAKLRNDLQTIGLEELGVIRVSEISPRFNEDFLTGKSDDGAPIPLDQNFFWEIWFERPTGPGVRRRFTVKGVPSYMATKFQWWVDLLRANDDRTRNGLVDQ